MESMGHRSCRFVLRDRFLRLPIRWKVRFGDSVLMASGHGVSQGSGNTRGKDNDKDDFTFTRRTWKPPPPPKDFWTREDAHLRMGECTLCGKRVWPSESHLTENRVESLRKLYHIKCHETLTATGEDASDMNKLMYMEMQKLREKTGFGCCLSCGKALTASSETGKLCSRCLKQAQSQPAAKKKQLTAGQLSLQRAQQAEQEHQQQGSEGGGKAEEKEEQEEEEEGEATEDVGISKEVLDAVTETAGEEASVSVQEKLRLLDKSRLLQEKAKELEEEKAALDEQRSKKRKRRERRKQAKKQRKADDANATKDDEAEEAD
eukprot:g56924.t1